MQISLEVIWACYAGGETGDAGCGVVVKEGPTYEKG